MWILERELIEIYQNESLPIFGEQILRERGRIFIATIFSESHVLRGTSFGIEAEAIGAV